MGVAYKMGQGGCLKLRLLTTSQGGGEVGLVASKMRMRACNREKPKIRTNFFLKFSMQNALLLVFFALFPDIMTGTLRFSAHRTWFAFPADDRLGG